MAFQEAFARGDLTALRDLVSPTQLSKTKARLAARPASSLQRQWAGRIESSAVLTVRYIPVDEMALNFAQIAVRFHVLAKAQLLEHGQVVRETDEKRIEENWVFERVTNRPDDHWRWCGSLPLPEGELSLLEMQEREQAASKT